MGWLFIVSLITIVVTAIIAFVHRDTPEKWYEIEEVQLGGFMTFFLSLLFVALIGGMYSGTHEGRDITAEGCETHVNSWDIVSAVRDKNVTGSFILGTGGVHQVDTYYVYRQETEGLLLSDYPAKRTFVVEQDEQPRYERIDHICPQPIYDFLWWSSGNTHHNINRKGTLYVPRDTILREFRL